MPVWKRIVDSEAGYAYNLSDAMAILDWRFPGFLQPLDDGTLVIASDYSGQHRESTHEAYSFLITTHSELDVWDSARTHVRREWLRDGRRMSFKRLQDRLRARALVPFLDAAFRLRGNIITVLVDKRVGSFCGQDTMAITEVLPDCFPTGTPNRTIEKMFALSTLLAMLVVGFRRERQPSYWISDEDETLDTHEKREGLARLTSYLSFGFARWREPADHWFFTTGSPEAPVWAEDLAAIPDLMAGTYCVLSGVLPRFFGGREVMLHTVKSESANDARGKFIMSWIGAELRPLRSVLLRLERDDHGDVRASYQCHAGNRRSG